MKLLNITYPEFLQNNLALNIWEKLFCKNGFHLFDEVYSAEETQNHYLYCDACELEVIINDKEYRNG